MKGTAPTPRTWALSSYAFLATVFVVCVAGQIFIAGLAIFDGAAYWATHKSFVHLFEYLPLVMLVLALVGRLGKGMIWLPVLAVAQMALQYALVNSGAIAAAFHPLNGTVLFLVAALLAYRSWRRVRWPAGAER